MSPSSVLSSQDFLRYYPPEKQGLRPLICQDKPLPRLGLRYYPPEKQGLRLPARLQDCFCWIAQILSSRKTRIKTSASTFFASRASFLRYYPPEKQGLRRASCARKAINLLSQILSSRKTRIKTLSLPCQTPCNRHSDTILQKNKD